MAVGIVSVLIEDTTISVLKSYNPYIYDETCDELAAYALELNLECLKYIHCAESCMFNYSQCQEILKKEIPAMRTKSLSKLAKEAIDGLEYAIKDNDNIYSFLMLEGE